MRGDLSQGSITKTMLWFAAPMILGNMLQQLYNIADTFIVGRFLGAGALAAVGSAYTLMTFLTSIFIGLCMGSGTVISICFGEKNIAKMKNCMFVSFVIIAGITLLIQALAMLFCTQILHILQVPEDIFRTMQSYVQVIFAGLGFVFLYNYFSFLLKSVGNSVTPLLFLAVSAVVNIFLDVLFVVGLHRGVQGAAEATVISQALSGVGIGVYTLWKEPLLRIKREDMGFGAETVKEIVRYSALTSAQQSVMNLGILMVQGLVNSFGTAVMAAFAAGVKIDSFAYMPAQEFGNAFSVFIAQNYGAKKMDRIRKGIGAGVKITVCFCIAVSILVWIFADPLMRIFVDGSESAIIAIGVKYLRIEGACYLGIGCLFLLYGLYRAIEKPLMSLVLTILSLGTRVALSYALAPVGSIGYLAIWWAIPIGWCLADAFGFIYYLKKCNKSLFSAHYYRKGGGNNEKKR